MVGNMLVCEAFGADGSLCCSVRQGLGSSRWSKCTLDGWDNLRHGGHEWGLIDIYYGEISDLPDTDMLQRRINCRCLTRRLDAGARLVV